MSKTVTQILDEIKSLPKTAENYERGKELIRSLGFISGLIESLRPGEKEITRAVIPWKTLTHKSELSYKPQMFNKSYQRASTPHNTMFYGCVIDLTEEITVTPSRIVTAFESSQLLRNGEHTVGIDKIIYGKWIVKGDIDLVALVYKPSFYQQGNNYFDKLYNAFHKGLNTDKRITELQRDEFKKIARFFCEEFGRKDISNEYDYFWSALFTEVICETGKDGVIYPSVRADGKFGMNVAIKPDVVDSRLEFVKGIECTLYKNKGRAYIPVDKHISLNNDTVTLSYNDSPQSTLEERLAEVDCRSIDELQGDNEVI